MTYKLLYILRNRTIKTGFQFSLCKYHSHSLSEDKNARTRVHSLHSGTRERFNRISQNVILIFILQRKDEK